MCTLGSCTKHEECQDFNTDMMRCTFKLAGNGVRGTAFVLTKTADGDTGRVHHVLVTAAHVLEGMSCPKAELVLRKRKGDTYERLTVPLTIRKGQKELWVRHPAADLAAMFIELPNEADIAFVPMSMLADDETFSQLRLHPGDELMCLGFPESLEGNPAGLPILRGAKIASFPLILSSEVRSFLIDALLFDGCSGGPAYLPYPKDWPAKSSRRGSSPVIVGLVSGRKMGSYDEKRKDAVNLGLGIVIHASLIKQTINQLPPPNGP